MLESIRCLALSLALLSGLYAQTITQNIVDGLTPPAIAPGAPIGVQQITELETINLYNGQLSTAIPLLTVGGRGEASYTMYARVTQDPYTVTTTPGPCSGNCPPGGPTTTHVATAFNTLSQYRSNYSPGVVYVKHSGRNGTQPCGTETAHVTSFSYVVFERPDGSEVALWDGTTPGPGCGSARVTRGPRFRATDGSGITFVADSGPDNLYYLQDLRDVGNADTNTISGTPLFHPRGEGLGVRGGFHL